MRFNPQIDHSFDQDQRRVGERRTLAVIVITATMMCVEIIAGWTTGSMALLADGLHMASHAAALFVAYLAYVYARQHAHNPRFSFGTGKVNALGGFVGALLLAEFALFMVWESGERLLEPTDIQFNTAMLVAVIGLLVNAASALLLGHEHGCEHGHAQECSHDHDSGDDHDHRHDHDHRSADNSSPSAGGHDHNLRSAYLHVLADALTSLLAIVALAAGKYWNWIWLDPAVGVLGAVLVTSWSWSLLRSTALVLLDHQAPQSALEYFADSVMGEDEGEVIDLHIWSIGPGIYSAEAVIVAKKPLAVEEYRCRIPSSLSIAHATIEVRTAAG